MGAGVFVTGTGTEVGKTVVAAVLARGTADRGISVAVFKPAVSGLDDGSRPDHEVLRQAARSGQSDDEIAPYRYAAPVSPHLGAELAGDPIEPPRLRAAATVAADSAEFLVCEGVGGLLVPLTLGYSVRDFAHDLGLPVVVAATPTLGTINHTLMTLESARAVGLTIAAVVLTPWPDTADAVARSNRETIERLGGAPVLTLPPFELDDARPWPALPLTL